jgi:arsenate reductase
MPRKKVLFICIENACRSQMAEALVKKYYPDIIKPFSAGSKPAQEVNDFAKEALSDLGIDASNSRPKGFEDLGEDKFDYVITMGCKDICPFIPAKKQINWQIEDPKGHNLTYFQEIRDKIKSNIDELVGDIKKEII